MNELQESLIASLKTNACNISDAIKKNKCSLEDFYSFLTISEFKAGFDEAKKLADDFARAQFMKLIQKGEKAAIIEYQKMLRQSDDANEYKRIRRDVMAVFIKSMETKSAVLKEFCHCFNTSKNTAEDYFKNVIIEYSLQSPAQRKKALADNNNSKMAQRFNDNNLSEIDMYRSMLQIALHDAESSEYPSERKGAMDKVIDISRRLEEVQERQRREAEADNTNLVDKVDAILFGSSVKNVERVRDEIDLAEVKAIEKRTS